MRLTVVVLPAIRPLQLGCAVKRSTARVASSSYASTVFSIWNTTVSAVPLLLTDDQNCELTLYLLPLSVPKGAW